MPRKPKEPTIIDAYNNVRHGLTARTIAVPGLEDPDDWIKFRDAVIQSFAPEGALECELAENVAEGLWRRRRVARHEQQLVDVERRRDEAQDWWLGQKQKVRSRQKQHDGEPPPSPDEVYRTLAGLPEGDIIVAGSARAHHKAERMLPGTDDLDRLMRYESHLARQIYHALHELQALQAARRGEASPLARLSILGGA